MHSQRVTLWHGTTKSTADRVADQGKAADPGAQMVLDTSSLTLTLI